jgi:hypothetical protein
MKGFAATAIIVVVVAVFIFMFIMGISGNYHPKSNSIGDVIGGFFGAIAETFGSFIAIANLMLWTMIFFAVQGIFLYGYYKIAQFIWKRVPEFNQWFEQTKNWFKKY